MAGRRTVLEAVPFVQGYGVETGLLVDIAGRFGTDALDDIRAIVDADNSDLYDVLAYIAFARAPLTRAERAAYVDHRLGELYPETPVPLDHRDPYTLLIAVLLSALITVCMNVLGVTLIAAMLVVPPVVGRLLTDSFGRMLGISVAVGTVCGFVGVYLSYYLDWASGPAVVLTAAAIFVAAYAVSGFRRRRLPAAAIDAHVG